VGLLRWNKKGRIVLVRQADPSTVLVNIFKSNTDRYFSFDEISQELEAKGIKLSQERLQRILDALEAWRRVQREEGVGEGRYTYYDTLDFGCPRKP
jgi:arginine repressor